MTDTLPVGRMISASKSGYRMEHPDNLVVFNANIYTRTRGKIWCGDLDVTADADALKAMAAVEGDELYVFRERDGRETAPPSWDAAVARVTSDRIETNAQ